MKKIFLFTHSFPYSKMSEAFIDVELQIASTLDVEITLVPLYSSSYMREIPANIKVSNKLSELSLIRKTAILFKMFVNPLFLKLIFKNKGIFKKWNNWYYAVKYLYGGLIIEDFLSSKVEDFPEGSILYSFWLNYTVLGFSLAKEKNSHFKTCKFYSRAHRYDLYAEEVGIFMPYREKMLECLEKVFSGSIDGVKFLTEKYPDFSSKIELGRLGVLPLKFSEKKNKTVDLSLISCSNVIPVKRVSLIYTSIKQFCEKNPNLKVSWVHIGNGSEMTQLNDIATRSTLHNLTVSLPGVKMISEIVELLEENEFDAFINFSLSEGLPVTLMMAISAGVPLIATDTGGNKEIVTKETGILFPLNFPKMNSPKRLSIV